ncbi:hypothetical protein VNO80_14650 [Phaseolus coccineus]|uniref:Uncharacterized protein n=1 Tax=Phaseolus coccineus TaxID=3886 RepID=A0AAN9MIB9_PHACN
MIVGMFDTGISLDCPSFNDSGYGPPPPTWKGKCVTGANFTGCNNKVIGAKFFNLQNSPEPNFSPAHDQGHGTHTSSTAAGMPVRGASLEGIGGGTARGGVARARIAMRDSKEVFSDPVAIGAFQAMKRGIITSCSAGNSGPATMTVENVAPWILTVAASNPDRLFTTVVDLGDGHKVEGMSINTFTPEKKIYPLVEPLLPTLQKAAMAMPDYSTTTLIPAVYVYSNTTGKTIDLYINSTKDAQAVIQKVKSTRGPAPFVASFSSRGPQSISTNILKVIMIIYLYLVLFALVFYVQPDLTAPGVDILAGYSKLATLSGDPEDSRRNVFNILSGTSMACPHAAGAATYVKSFLPHWSPAAIKSALMTTATPMRINDITVELGSGSGQNNPVKALDPGLLYNNNIDSYIAFLCKEGYYSSSIGIIIGTKGFDCSGIDPAQGTDGINYPSMHTQIIPNGSISAIFYRSVTNVGLGNSTYRAKVTSPKGLSIKVIPDTLIFSGVKVMLKGPPVPKESNLLSASLEWNDSQHNIRSPIVVYKRTL